MLAWLLTPGEEINFKPAPLVTPASGPQTTMQSRGGAAIFLTPPAQAPSPCGGGGSWEGQGGHRRPLTPPSRCLSTAGCRRDGPVGAPDSGPDRGRRAQQAAGRQQVSRSGAATARRFPGDRRARGPSRSSGRSRLPPGKLAEERPDAGLPPPHLFPGGPGPRPAAAARWKERAGPGARGGGPRCPVVHLSFPGLAFRPLPPSGSDAVPELTYRTPLGRHLIPAGRHPEEEQPSLPAVGFLPGGWLSFSVGTSKSQAYSDSALKSPSAILFYYYS